MKTKTEIARCYGWLQRPVVFPKGTNVIPAKNQPGNQYWICVSDDVARTLVPERYYAEFVAWMIVYGFLLDETEVEE